ncbi:transcription factor, putative [Ixodes scapularis]|uniref:Transcription factor, putative n=1 Tax=Ixodes scapularis TaxID=6945 RepID=B7QEW0_IXOSC|nr:transcription factor, putative [Ixodes scapularis]|eukprot:XP_002414074.1 transcription factor, putative [Ixodes scapularis]
MRLVLPPSLPQPPQGMGGPMKERRTVWQGQVEYQDKMPGNPRNVYTLQCTVSTSVTNGEPEVCADKWPPKLTLQLMPKTMLMNVVLAVKNAARCVVLAFGGGPEGGPAAAEGLHKLSRFMSSAWLGLVHFASPPADIKLMLVVYMPDKNFYMGMIANDQETLYGAVKQVVDTHRKQQQTKSKMLQTMSGGTMAQAGGMNMPVPVPNPAMAVNQVSLFLPPSLRPSFAEWRRLYGGPPRAALVSPGGAPPHPVNQAASVSQQQAVRLSQLEAERQQNLMKIQQLQQTLEAAQAKELQYKAAQEQQTMLERQRVVNHQVQQLAASGGMVTAMGGPQGGPPGGGPPQGPPQQPQGGGAPGWDDTALLDLLGGGPHNG